MKRILSILLAVMLLAALCACGEPGEQIAFRNDTGEKIAGFYISSVTSEDWGDKLNYASVGVGSTIHVDAACLTDGPGVEYDIGAIDETGFGYDVYEVPLQVGDTIALSAEGDTAIVIVTGENGSVNEYYGYAYQEAEID